MITIKGYTVESSTFYIFSTEKRVGRLVHIFSNFTSWNGQYRMYGSVWMREATLTINILERDDV